MGRMFWFLDDSDVVGFALRPVQEIDRRVDIFMEKFLGSDSEVRNATVAAPSPSDLFFIVSMTGWD